MTSRPIRLAGAALLAAGSLGVLAACGSSDDDGGTSSSDLAASCKANDAVNTGFDNLFEKTPALQSDNPQPTPAQKEQIRANFDRYAAPALAQIEKNPPDEIADELKAAIASARKVRDGDVRAIQSPAFEQQTRKIDAFYFDNCGGQKNTVKAIDYAYDGLKPTFTVGQVHFKMQNTGKEVHEMQIARLKPGVNKTFAQILKLPLNEGDKYVEQVAGADPVPSGQSSYASADLVPGQYIAICFVPQGTTSLQKPGKGKPHFLLGMQKEFTVK